MRKIVKTTFCNTEKDDFGMPTIYRNYILIGRNPNPDKREALEGQGITKVYPISSSTPNINPECVVAFGGIDGSIEEAINRLKNLNPELILSVSQSVNELTTL